MTAKTPQEAFAYVLQKHRATFEALAKSEAEDRAKAASQEPVLSVIPESPLGLTGNTFFERLLAACREFDTVEDAETQAEWENVQRIRRDTPKPPDDRL